MAEHWGIDLGGTKIEGVVLRDGAEVPGSRLRLPTERENGYEHILGQIEKVVRQIQAATGLAAPTRLGIGTPGAVDRNGALKNSNTVCLIGKPLVQDLGDLLNAEVRCANDANCFALAEATLGAARGADVVFGIIMGTGVGGGIVVNGQVLNGLQGIAGEWGHNMVEPNGHRCYCGKIGCGETVLSGPSLERTFTEWTGEKVPLLEINRRAEAGDLVAMRLIDRLCEKFGEAISVVVNILDPDVLLLGGGVSNVPAFQRRAHESMIPWVFNQGVVDTRVVLPQLGDSAGVFGAAMLAA